MPGLGWVAARGTGEGPEAGQFVLETISDIHWNAFWLAQRVDRFRNPQRESVTRPWYSRKDRFGQHRATAWAQRWRGVNLSEAAIPLTLVRPK